MEDSVNLLIHDSKGKFFFAICNRSLTKNKERGGTPYNFMLCCVREGTSDHIASVKNEIVFDDVFQKNIELIYVIMDNYFGLVTWLR